MANTTEYGEIRQRVQAKDAEKIREAKQLGAKTKAAERRKDNPKRCKN